MNPTKLILGLFIWILPHVTLANVRLNALFSDHMVVQRETRIPVWGWADQDEKVTIKASWGASAETIAGTDGTWRVKLKTPKAGGPFQIFISGKNDIVLKDVLAGEVWLCSGQSNMDHAMNKFLNDSREPQYQPLVEYIRHEVATAKDPWLRHIEVPHSTSIFEKKTNFEGQWISVDPKHTGNITATGYFFAKELRDRLNVPVGLVECDWGGTRIQPWISEEVYRADKEMMDYFEADRKKVMEIIKNTDVDDYVDTVFVRENKEWIAGGKKDRRPFPIKYPTINEQVPATLYNGMLSAVIPYAIKGVIWYQGESNSHFMEESYGKYFSKLIKSWRADWGQGDFPFYWMQLANYHVPDARSDNGWATVNDQLRRSLKLPHTGMAVLYDIGEAKDVHPHNKMDAGKRLALWALQKDYHLKVPAVSGPLYQNYKIKGDKIIVIFNEVGSGLMVGHKELLKAAIPVDEPLKWFQIAGEDGVWKAATAKIISKNCVEVSNPEVEEPRMVRYAWSSNPEGANLYNKEGLPAAVFTTTEIENQK